MSRPARPRIRCKYPWRLITSSPIRGLQGRRFSAAGYCAGRQGAAGASLPSRALPGTSDGKRMVLNNAHANLSSAFPRTGGARVRYTGLGGLRLMDAWISATMRAALRQRRAHASSVAEAFPCRGKDAAPSVLYAASAPKKYRTRIPIHGLPERRPACFPSRRRARDGLRYCWRS